MKNEKGTIVYYAIGVIILVVAVFAIVKTNDTRSIGQSYRKEAISLLEKYKERKIDAKEAGKRLNDLENELWKEYKESEGKQASELLDLWTDINVVNIDIYYRGYASDYKIDNAIKEIKK